MNIRIRLRLVEVVAKLHTLSIRTDDGKVPPAVCKIFTKYLGKSSIFG